MLHFTIVLHKVRKSWIDPISKCTFLCICRYAVSLKEVCTSHRDFYLSYDEETQTFNLKKNHPYYYQVQQQLLVTKRKFALFMVYIENDVAVVYVPEDIPLCNEIKIRSQFYFREVLLPQLVSDYFYASHKAVTMMEELSVIEVDTPTSNPQASASQSPAFQAQDAHNNVETAMTNLSIPSFYCICQRNLPGEATVNCRNLNCIVKVFHKCCIIPNRIRFGPNWTCKNCLSDEKKSKKSKDKENQTSNSVNAKRLPKTNLDQRNTTRKPLHCKN